MIQLAHIRKTYGKETVLKDISFSLEARQTMSVLGRSGCGKSTLLKIMAGMETADGGHFEIAGQPMLGLKPQQRGVVYLGQEPLLFPHLSVAANLAYGLNVRGLPPKEVAKSVDSMAEQLGLQAQLKKNPQQLSGGQKQRVSFGRALIINPRVMLLDEPFGSLDAQTRSDMQALFLQIRKEFSITSLFVTHDLKEALLMGDQLAMMQQGSLKVYPSAHDFISSPESGAAEEINFWKKYQEDEKEL